ncbi:MAG TPA: hypothetical protein VHP31_08935 [Caproicibacter sp.]|nr:hypothetical protein [Caproicibacter sp.]
MTSLDDFLEPDFDFAKDITLNKYDFMIYGKGERPVYCQRPHVQGLAADGSGAKVIYTTCDTMGCPSCGKLWALQKVFKSAVHVEAYAIYSGSRPSVGEASVRDDRAYTFDNIRKIRRNGNNRLKKHGVTAGLSLFHPFRIKAEVKPALRSILNTEASSGFWKFIRDDHNEGNLDRINDILGTDCTDWYQLTKFSPHFHYMCFPGTQKFTGDKDLFIKKNCFDDGEKKHWTLEIPTDTVRYLAYLMSHVGQLAQGKGTRFKPVSPFGEMFKMSPEKLVPSAVLHELRLEILAIMNQGREKPLVLDGDTISYGIPEQKEEVEYIPMSDFRLVSMEANENARAYEEVVRDLHPENLSYVRYMISLYNYVSECPDVPHKFKRLFLEPFEELPAFILPLHSENPVRIMFERGLIKPPDTFKLYVCGHAGKST